MADPIAMKRFKKITVSFDTHCIETVQTITNLLSRHDVFATPLSCQLTTDCKLPQVMSPITELRGKKFYL